MSSTCVLAFSGGLDTSVCVAWLKEQHDLDVIAVTVDVGQGRELDGVGVRAEAAGAVDHIVIDARQEFVESFCWPALRAQAVYEGRYPLVSALSRPLIARHLVRIARERGAMSLAHGCTGKGNDQVRFEATFAALAPELEVHAPIRSSKMQRDEALVFAERHGIPVVATAEKPYSVDENLWGRAVESGPLEDPWTQPEAKDVYEMTVDPADAPDEPDDLIITFDRGTPTAVDGCTLGPVELVAHIHDRAGRHGVGRIDMIENRLVGIKSREVYEVPAATTLLAAHRDLEALTLDRDVATVKRQVADRYAKLVYDGLWFSPLRAALDAFVSETQDAVTGDVRMRLSKGTAEPTGRRSDRSLYAPELATYGSADDAFGHEDAAGFIRLWALPIRTWAQRHPEGR